MIICRKEEIITETLLQKVKYYFRDHQCNFTIDGEQIAYRMCNSYWRSQELLQKHEVESFILGMISQIAEREDHIMVEDLRGTQRYLILFPVFVLNFSM